jgi:hypothetical protein
MSSPIAQAKMVIEELKIAISYPVSLGPPRARRVDLILCNFTENPHLPHGRLFVGKAPEVTAERGCARNIVL